uniref:Uncharacterized protein n=1 Tax=Oryza punctata TaxID=4537 RepID=A0A0E0LR04_ORYPU
MEGMRSGGGCGSRTSVVVDPTFRTLAAADLVLKTSAAADLVPPASRATGLLATIVDPTLTQELSDDDIGGNDNDDCGCGSELARRLN